MGVEPADDWRRGVVVDEPPPTSPPTFELAPDAVSGTPLWPVQEILDGAFFVIGTVLVMWLGWIMVTVDFDGWFGIGSVFLFWVLLAYVGLPRLQEVLSRISVRSAEPRTTSQPFGLFASLRVTAAEVEWCGLRPAPVHR